MNVLENDLHRSTSSFTFTLSGENEVDAICLSIIIDSTVKLAMFATTEFQNNNSTLKVQALQAGSFEIVFLAICMSAPSLITTIPEVMKMAKTKVEIIKGYFDIQKHLGGEKPKEITHGNNGKTIITNPNGQTIETPSASVNIITNIYASEQVARIASCVANNNPNEGFSIRTEDTVEMYTASDVQKIAMPFSPANEVGNETEKNIIPAILFIRSPDLLQNAQWKFRYKNKTIWAKIRDTNFMRSVDAGLISVKKGSYINAKLEVSFGIDESKPKYFVNEVIDGRIHNDPDQLTLNDI